MKNSNQCEIFLNQNLQTYCSLFGLCKKCHLVKSLQRKIDNAGGDGGNLEDLDDGDVGHGVDRVEQDQVEGVDDRGTGKRHLTNNDHNSTQCSARFTSQILMNLREKKIQRERGRF